MSERIAVVTGGASGIGQGVAQRFAADGFPVAVLDQNGDAADETAAKIVADGGTAIGVQADLTDPEQAASAVERARAEFGPITVLANCAGAVQHGPFLEQTFEVWSRTLAINLNTTYHVCQAVLPDMIAAKFGRIVNIASSAVHSGAPGLAGYTAAKSAIVGLTKVLALEFAKYNIIVNAVAPGAVDTPMFRRSVESGSVDVEKVAAGVPLGRIGLPEDIAATCAFLVSDGASYMTGQLLGVNGGINT